MRLVYQQDCFGRFLSRVVYRRIFLWISSHVFQNPRVVIPFWLWLIDLPNMGTFFLLVIPTQAKAMATVFVKEVIRFHRISKSIVNDRDPIFLSDFWTELFRLQGTQLNMSIAYHPKSDGQTEVLNRGLETYLRYFASKQLKHLCSWLHWVE